MDITTVIVNFKTRKLTETCVRSFRGFYPEVPLILVDNGSGDGSAELIKKLSMEEGIAVVLNEENIGHGPAMHNVIETLTTRYVFTLDSDCEVFKDGFLEQMLDEFAADPNLYAIGWLRWVDRESGVPLDWHVQAPPKEKFCPYIHPHAAVYDVEKYHTLQPFGHHGAPCLWNMLSVAEKGYGLRDFLIEKYVKHWIAGTRRMYGGKWNPHTKERPGMWKANDNHPI